MQPQLQQLLRRYQGLKPRERVLVAGVCLALLVTLWTNLVYAPLAKRGQARLDEITTLQTTLRNLQQQQSLLQQQRSQDPNQELKARLQRTQEEISKLDVVLKDKLKGLIDPKQMASMLEAMLRQNAQLQLQRVQSLGAQPLLAQDEAADKQDAATAPPVVEVYRHAVEIEFTGNYLATLAYLQALQELPWDFYWDAVRYEVEKYPTARVVITVHTLSLQEGWIGV